jgi:hypothetical protein
MRESIVQSHRSSSGDNCPEFHWKVIYGRGYKPALCSKAQDPERALTSRIVGDIVRTSKTKPAGKMAPGPRHPFSKSGKSSPAPLNRRIFEGEIQMARLIQPLSGSRILNLLFMAAALVVASSSANAQGRKAGVQTQSGGEEASASFNEYRGIQLGMLAEEVRKKLGNPKDKGDEQDFYIFDETETAQIVYDKTHKVITISADFLKPTGVLSAKQVIGTEVEAKADGSVYKMVRYPKAGYWLSYNRTSGASPLTTITLQKIQ